MKDAFGVEKSFAGGAWKPISAMSGAERALIRGSHKSAQGMTNEDAGMAFGLSRGLMGNRTLMAQAASNPKIKIKQRKNRKGRTVNVVRAPASVADQGPNRLPEAMYLHRTPGRGESQRKMPANVVLPGKSHRWAKDAKVHEFEHTTVRRPASRFVRMMRHPEKNWGEEARANSVMSPEARRMSDYERFAHGRETYGAAPIPGGERGYQRYREVQAKIGRARGD